MQRLRSNAIALAAWLAVVGTAPALAADGAKAPNGPARVEMTDDGAILVTPAGMTLYMFGADDGSPGKSVCTKIVVRDMNDPSAGLGKLPLPGNQFLKSCAEAWPPYMADAKAQPSGDWSVIDRAEGKQWTYRGRPLYTSARDTKPGDRNGSMSGFFGQRGWRLASPPLDLPPGLQIIRNADALVLATSNGRPVYTPRGGTRVRQASVGLEELFLPVAAPYVAKLGGDWGALNANAGKLQYAFKGKALFAAPDSLTDRDIAEAGGWDMVIYRKRAGAPPEIETRLTMVGDVYTDKNGKTLYTYSCTAHGCDDPGGPAAYMSALCGDGKECARRWRPYVASANARPSGEWSIVDVPVLFFTEANGRIYPPDVPRVKGWAYRGRPVFTYYEDKEPGDNWGDQVRWFALSSFGAVYVPGRGMLD